MICDAMHWCNVFLSYCVMFLAYYRVLYILLTLVCQPHGFDVRVVHGTCFYKYVLPMLKDTKPMIISSMYFMVYSCQTT
jgi:hypothetical protein